MKSLIRKNILEFQEYSSARKIGGNGTIWLNANESPFNKEYQSVFFNLNRYPELQPKNVLLKYANYLGLNDKNIIMTRGSNEAIELILKVFCNPGIDEIIYCPPVYGMYAISANIIGIKTKDIPLTKDFELDLSKIKDNLDNVKVIFICSPNNPTGNFIRREDILNLLEFTKNKVIVVVDEAYVDFQKESSIVNYINDYDNLVIMRTLSKAFGLAGIRAGFAVTNSYLIEIFNKVLTPYSIPSIVIDIVDKALSKDNINIIENDIKTIANNMEYLKNELSLIPNVKNIYPSSTNYLLAKYDDAQNLFKYLWNKGIIIRNQSMQIYLSDCLRITIGTIEEMKKVVTEIKEFYK